MFWVTEATGALACDRVPRKSAGVRARDRAADHRAPVRSDWPGRGLVLGLEGLAGTRVPRTVVDEAAQAPSAAWRAPLSERMRSGGVTSVVTPTISTIAA